MTLSVEEWESVWKSSPDAYLLLDLAENILAVSNSYLAITHAPPQIVGLNYFDMVPHDPKDPHDGVRRSKESFAYVRDNGQPHVLGLVRNDVPTETGFAVIRYWTVTNSPVLDSSGNTAKIIHRLEDVTDLVQIQSQLGILSGSLVQVGSSLDALQTILPLPPTNTRTHKPFGEE